MDRSLTFFVAGVTLLGAAVVAAAAVAWDHEDIAFLAAVAGLAAASESTDFSPFPGSRVSVSITLIFAAGTFGGLAAGAVAALAVAAADFTAHRKAPAKAVFNGGALLLTAAAFVAVIDLLAPGGQPTDWTALLGPVVAATVAAFAVNSSLVSAAMALDRGRNWLETWYAFRWLLPHYVILGVLALFAAAAYDRWEIPGLALVAVPFAMAWLVMKQAADGAAGANRFAGNPS